MSMATLRARWRSGEGIERAQGIIACLAGVVKEMPDGVGIREGRLDLRGLAWTSPQPVAMESARGARLAVLDGVVELRGVMWRGLDLSGAQLPGLRFLDSRIDDCRFDAANCADWRLWASQVVDCSFVGAKLSDAAIGAWWGGLRRFRRIHPWATPRTWVKPATTRDPWPPHVGWCTNT